MINATGKPLEAPRPVDPDEVRKIIDMTEWEVGDKWDYTTVKTNSVPSPEDLALAQAQRFLSAQAFLLSWQRGKVPTGWHRPRRLTDFEGKYPPVVLEAARATMQHDITERNQTATDRIKELSSTTAFGDFERGTAKVSQGVDAKSAKPITKEEIDGLKSAYAKFSTDLYDIKAALANASNVIAELSLRTQALVERGSGAP